MPRNISAATLALLSQRVGIEPINIVRIQWTVGGQAHFYSDRRMVVDGVTIEGKILELADLESVISIDKSVTSTSVKMALDDTDGAIKQIYNVHNIHFAPVAIFQWFNGLPLSEMFIIFEGYVSSPIIWKESDRSLSFDVLTKLNDAEVGFSVEEGDFTNIPNILLNRAWPIPFGTVINLPTIQMDDIPTGTIRIPIGIPDPNLNRQIAFIAQKAGEQIAKAACLSRAAAELKFNGRFMDDDENEFRQGQQMDRQARDILNKVRAQQTNDAQRLTRIQNKVKTFDVKNIPIINGHHFHQGVAIELDINGAHYYGTMNGDNFSVISRRGPYEIIHHAPGGKSMQDSRWDLIIEDTAEQNDADYAKFIFNQPQDDSGTHENRGNPCEPPKFYLFGQSPVVASEKLKENGYFFANAGSSVKPGGAYDIRYIISIVPGTVVIDLSARRTVNDLKVVYPIPPQYYSLGYETWYATDGAPAVTALIATFHQPLTSHTLQGEDWDNAVFATVISPIGPNVVDILIWLIQTYTSYSIDTTSFSYVRTKQENYPANFALMERKNITTLLKEIAWQARCSIWLRDGVFYIKYLSEPGPTIDTITEDDVEQQSMEINCTATEDLVTKFTAVWTDDYSLTNKYEVIFRYNINIYGLHQQRFDFYIYNSVDLVIKSATFWLIRMCNTWKKLTCKTFINKLTLETMDNVLINFAHPWVANVPVIGQIEKATFNSNDMSINLDIWLPVRLGEMYPYEFAYPANLDPQIIFPPIDDVAGKFAGDVDVQGDIGAEFNLITFKKGRGSVPQTRPSDGFDAINGPTILVTTPAYGTGTGAQPANQQRPGVQPNHRNYPDPPQANTNDTTSKGFPAKVVSGSGDTYTCIIYPFGLDFEGKTVDNVKQLQIDKNAVITPDTWVMVNRIVYYTNGKLFFKYYMEVPIWLAAPP